MAASKKNCLTNAAAGISNLSTLIHDADIPALAIAELENILRWQINSFFGDEIKQTGFDKHLNLLDLMKPDSAPPAAEIAQRPPA